MNAVIEPIPHGTYTTYGTYRTDCDIPEMAAAFAMRSAKRTTDITTTTFGDITFRKVDPLREPLKVADTRLQQRLETLCETLRAKY